MNEQKFDPMTGQPIQAAPKFDPMTGQPLNQQGGNFDPVTGQPLNQAAPAQGANQQPYGGYQQPYGSNQQPYGANQQPGAYGYNNMAAQHNQSQKNNKVAVIVLVVLVIALVAVLGFVGFQASKLLNKASDAGLKTEQTQEELSPIEGDVNGENGENGEQKVEGLEGPQTEEPVVDEQKEDAGEAASVEEPVEETPTEETPSDETKLGGETSGTPVERTEVDPTSAFAFTIGDKSYQLPFRFQELIEDGWKYYSDSDEDIVLEAGRGEYIYMICPGDTECNLSITVTNFSLNAESIKDGYVTEITLYSNDAERLGKKMTMHGGDIVLGQSSEADLRAAFGEPSRVSDDSNTLWYDYGDERDYEHDSKVFFSIEEDGTVSYAALENNLEPEDFEQVEVSKDAPAYLSNYKAPTELGTDPFSGNFKLDGKLYNLPVPLQILVDDGWVHGVEDETTVGAGQGYIITLEKNHVSMTCTVYNFDDKATILRHTIVTSVDTSSSSIFDNGMELPDGLNAHMTEAELTDYLKKHNITNYEHNNSYNTYTIPFDQTGNDRAARGNKYRIRINDDGTIDDIDIDNYGWTVQ